MQLTTGGSRGLRAFDSTTIREIRTGVAGFKLEVVHKHSIWNNIFELPRQLKSEALTELLRGRVSGLSLSTLWFIINRDEPLALRPLCFARAKPVKAEGPKRGDPISQTFKSGNVLRRSLLQRRPLYQRSL